MNSGQFWDILQAAYRAAENGTTDDWFEALKTELAKLPTPQILRFRHRFDDLIGAAYKTDLWGAASLINGGCSNDGFHYFRCWLIGMGQAVYENALDNPDSLADVLEGEGPC